VLERTAVPSPGWAVELEGCSSHGGARKNCGPLTPCSPPPPTPPLSPLPRSPARVGGRARGVLEPRRCSSHGGARENLRSPHPGGRASSRGGSSHGGARKNCGPLTPCSPPPPTPPLSPLPRSPARVGGRARGVLEPRRCSSHGGARENLRSPHPGGRASSRGGSSHGGALENCGPLTPCSPPPIRQSKA